jgi:peroxiredoxin Q/BCP
VAILGGLAMADQPRVRVGDPAPDFTLTSATGEPVTLSDFRGRSNVVLYFYPKDYTPACTLEACAFRDSYEAFREAGAEVIGVSTDSAASHRRFAGRFGLPFLLLSDHDGAVRSLYGVPRTMGLFPGRVTYLIDREGVVRHVFSSQFQPNKHVTEALAVLKSLRDNTQPLSG